MAIMEKTADYSPRVGSSNSIPGSSRVNLHDVRRALGKYATGVAIITCADNLGRRFGITCNSFAPISLDPPLISWCLRRESQHTQHFSFTPYFAVNVLSTSQRDVANAFTKSDLSAKFRFGEWQERHSGAPLLDGSAAWFECRNASKAVLGDHIMFIGEVVASGYSGASSLVYYESSYCSAVPAFGVSQKAST